VKIVEKYTTFKDLKSSKEKTRDYKSIMKKHNEFKKLIISLVRNKIEVPKLK
jgi:hypothetical protein